MEVQPVQVENSKKRRRECSKVSHNHQKISKRFENAISIEGCSFHHISFLNFMKGFSVKYDINGFSCNCGKCEVKSVREIHRNLISIANGNEQQTDPHTFTCLTSPIEFKSEKTDKIYKIDVNSACGMNCNCGAIFGQQRRSHCKHITSFINHLISSFFDRMKSHGCCSHMEDIIYKFLNQYVSSLMALKSFSKSKKTSEIDELMDHINSMTLT